MASRLLVATRAQLAGRRPAGPDPRGGRGRPRQHRAVQARARLPAQRGPPRLHLAGQPSGDQLLVDGLLRDVRGAGVRAPVLRGPLHAPADRVEGLQARRGDLRRQPGPGGQARVARAGRGGLLQLRGGRQRPRALLPPRGHPDGARPGDHGRQPERGVGAALRGAALLPGARPRRRSRRPGRPRRPHRRERRLRCRLSWRGSRDTPS
mmetsp:Transcript_71480/g.186329  ORF Transcript_71480/g.186329 Transcript_71480/m.186329 type:complete len:208 (+) Transcript_71480:192-815(+)